MTRKALDTNPARWRGVSRCYVTAQVFSLMRPSPPGLSEAYRRSNPGCLRFHRLDSGRVTKDLGQIERSRKRLIKLRHKLYAHKDLDTILSGKRDGFLDSHGEVRALIELAHDIWNYYSLIWNASTHSDKTIGADDYRWLFECLRRGLKTKSLADRFQFERIQKRHKRRSKS